jgi:hypothetical protein
MPDVPTPSFEDTAMTEDEKLAAISKWKIHRAKHDRKPRNKTSHVYFYFRKRILPGYLYPEFKGSPAILQEYRWTCNICELEPQKLRKKYDVLESHRNRDGRSFKDARNHRRYPQRQESWLCQGTSQ